jgi:hypothetical protein
MIYILETQVHNIDLNYFYYARKCKDTFSIQKQSSIFEKVTVIITSSKSTSFIYFVVIIATFLLINKSS